MPEPSAAPSLVPITLAFLHESFRRSAACRGRLPARDGALHVVNACLPVGIAEIKLAQIPLQVGFRKMLVHTVDAPLQVRKIELAELLSESWVLDSPNTDFVAMQAGVFRAAGLDPPRL